MIMDQRSGPSLSGAEAFQHVSKKWGEKRAAMLLVDNPRAALLGEEIPPLEQIAAKKSWQFWK